MQNEFEKYDALVIVKGSQDGPRQLMENVHGTIPLVGFHSIRMIFLRKFSRIRAAELFPKLNDLVVKLRGTNSLTQKLALVKEHDELHAFLKTLHYSGPFHITSKTLDKADLDLNSESEYDYIEDILIDLENRTITGNIAASTVGSFIRKHKEHQDLIKCIIDKDLRVRLGSKSILKAISSDNVDGDLPIALAEDMKKSNVKSRFEESLSAGEAWYASRKLDGIRCIAIISEDSAEKVTLKSRQGKDLNRLEHIRKAIAESVGKIEKDFVLDGELCLFEGADDPDLEGSKENFRKASGLVGSVSIKNETTNICFVAFDCIKKEEFLKKGASEPLRERLERLKRNFAENAHFKVLPQNLMTSEAEVQRMVEKSRSRGWEGLILRRDTAYVGKRSSDLIKVKDFYDSEFKVVGLETGSFRVIKDGLEISEEMLSSLTIEHKGNRIGVGSGFTMEERRNFMRMGNDLVGRKITVCYFEETVNKSTGLASLRFPVFKGFYTT